VTAPSEAEWSMATVMFVDIRGFTALADRSTARHVVGYLNAFFDVAVPLIERHGGSVNQLLGDGLLAAFVDGDHADRALAAGRELLAAVADTFGEQCRIGVGLNSGLVVVGTIHAGGLNHPGVVGDPVNVAARVEAATRELDEPLLATEATRVLLEAGRAQLSERGAIALDGKPKPVAVYALDPAATS
jgi:adenylate cyclase